MKIKPMHAIGLFIIFFGVATLAIMLLPPLGVAYGQTITGTFKNTDGSPIVGAKCSCYGWDCECLPGYCEGSMKEQGFTDSQGQWKFKHLHAGGQVSVVCYCPGTSTPQYKKSSYNTAFTITGDCGISPTTTIGGCTHNQLKCMNNKVYWCDMGTWKITQDCRNYPGTTCSCKNGDCDCYHEISTCSDSDGGKDYYEKGTVETSTEGSYTDYCKGDFVVEYYCVGGYVESYEKDCDVGLYGGYCSDGRCYSKGTPPTTTTTARTTTTTYTTTPTTSTTSTTTTLSIDCTLDEVINKTCEDGTTEVEWCVCKGTPPRWVCDEDWESKCPGGIPFGYIVLALILVIGGTYYYQKKRQ